MTPDPTAPRATAPTPASRAAVPALASRAVSVGASPVREILALTARPEVISFAGGLPAPELFDAAAIAQAYARVQAEQPRKVLQYSTTEGDPALRGAVAARLSGRGLDTAADGLLVTGGSQQGLALVATALLEPGDDGVIPEALEELALRERPKLLYLVPNFQNPTGRTLPLARRRAVAAVAERHGLWIAEDDPYGDLRFEGERVPWIAALEEAADRTVLLGSFSKIMAPGMRLGWLRAPGALLRACVIAKQAADLHTSTVDQAAAARYLADHDLDAHLDRVRTAYRARRDALLAGLPAALPAGSTWNRPEGGMFLWVRLPEGYDATALLPAAVGHDVAYVPGLPFFAEAPEPGALRMSFTTHTPEEIAEGLRRLAKVFA
jgi:2-aminoadipate transaminase